MTAIQVEIIEGEGRGETHMLSGIAILGRGASCSLQIQSRGVSREHAMIREEEGVGFVVEDLDSRSGTWVNGVRTRKAVLLDGDTVRIGPTSLRVRMSSPVKGEVPIDQIEMVQTAYSPTTRLSLDVVKFRASARYLKDSGLTDLESDSEEEAAAPDPEPETQDPDTGRARPSLARRLELLCEISNSLASIHEPSRLTRETAMRLFAMFPQARRIGFFETEEDPDGGESVLRPTYLVDRSEREKGNAVQISRSVVQQAVSERRAVLSEDVQLDPRFAVSESLTHAGVYSIMCAPLALGERMLGALYIDSTDGALPFDEGGLRLVTGVAAILAAAIENARLFAKVQAESVRRASLERYFSPDLVDRLLRGEVPLAREGRKASGTILFVDIRGFTRLTLTTDPTQLVATLNAYFACMQRIIFRTRGTVERFGGDSILAYWGIVDQDPESPAHAVRAALAMQVEMFRLNPELGAAGWPQLKVGVGLNTGEVVAGDVGSAERYEFTILGDPINMARRFESEAGGWEVVAGEATIAALGGRALHTPLPPITVKGKDAGVRVSLLHGLRALQKITPRGLDRERADAAIAGLPPGAPSAPANAYYDLAVAGQLDLGSGPEPTVASALRLAGGRVQLEVLSPHDPEPGTRVRVILRLARSNQLCTADGVVLEEAIEDTLLLGPNLAVSGSGVQRIRVRIERSQALLGYLRLG